MTTPVRILYGAMAAILHFIESVWDVVLFILSLKVLPLAWHVREIQRHQFPML